jgi:fucose permease
MRASFGLPLDALGPLLVAFTSGYVASSFGGGRLCARLGLGKLLVLSCALTGASLCGYAATGSWAVVVALAFVAGLGAGGIDTGINTYASTHHSPRMLNWLHACYGIGAAGGPVIMTAVLAGEGPWQRGYALVGAAQQLLAIAFVATLRAWPTATASGTASDGATPSIRATLRVPAIRWSIALFLVYTGLELAIGVWAFTLLTEARGVSRMAGGSSVSLYWAALTAGRVLGAVLAGFVPAAALLRGCLFLLTAALALLAAGLSPSLDLAALLVAGAAAGPVFPTLIATTPARVGQAHAGNAIGMQIAAAAIGQSTIPWLLGAAGDHVGLEALAVGLAAVGIAVVTVHGALHTQRATPGAGVEIESGAATLSPSPGDVAT